MKTLDKIRRDPRVEFVDVDDDGIIITVKQGWSFDPLDDNRVTGGDTATEALAALRSVRPYAGPYTD